jgi:Ca2+-binding EF-hand superfamily protein
LKLIKDGSGSISEKEWRIAMRSFGFEISKTEVKAMMKIVDTDGNGTIELDEYIKVLKNFY